MNSLEQQPNNFIGSAEAVRNLGDKEKVEILVVADSHGRILTVKNILQNFGPKSDVFVFCGDGISDVLDILNMSVTDSDIASCLPAVICMVQGNGDSSMYPVKFDPKNGINTDGIHHRIDVPSENIINAAGHSIYVVHGHRQRVYYGLQDLQSEAERFGTALALYGHTHVAAKEENSVLLINPGSCTVPRRGMPQSFAVVTLFKDRPIIEPVFYKISYTAGPEYIPFVPSRFVAF